MVSTPINIESRSTIISKLRDNKQALVQFTSQPRKENELVDVGYIRIDIFSWATSKIQNFLFHIGLVLSS